MVLNDLIMNLFNASSERLVQVHFHISVTKYSSFFNFIFFTTLLPITNKNPLFFYRSLKSLKRRLEDPDEVVNIEAHAVKSKIILIE